MNGSRLFWIRFCMSSLCCFSAPAAWGQERPDRLTSRTHLNVTSRQIVHLATNCLVDIAPNDGGIQFFNYDIGGNPFRVPKGFSFVITDIIAGPCALVPNLTQQRLIRIFVGNTGSRHFVATFTGHVPQHYALSGGLVVPEFGRLTAYNIFPADAIVQVLGYFVRGPGLQEFHPFPFPEDDNFVSEDEKSDN
jgi:hypothetical protein